MWDTEVLAASGEVASGPRRVGFVTITATSGGPGTVELKDGGSGGTTLWGPHGTDAASETRHFPFGKGIGFGQSVYAVLTNVEKATIGYR